MKSQLEEMTRENSNYQPQNSIYVSLRSEVRQSLSEEQKDFVRSLDKFEAPYVEEKLLKDGKFESSEEYKEAFTEFKKYMTLIKL